MNVYSLLIRVNFKLMWAPGLGCNDVISRIPLYWVLFHKFYCNTLAGPKGVVRYTEDVLYFL